MKKHEDIAYNMFELLEGDLSPEQEAALMDVIKDDEGLKTDWEFMQMTQLEAPNVTYKHKKKLLKKDTTLIAFSAVQWRRVASIAAIFAVCIPIWNYLFTNPKGVEEMAGSATELIPAESSENEDITRPSEVVVDATEIPSVNQTKDVEKVPTTPSRVVVHQPLNQEDPMYDTELVSVTPVIEMPAIGASFPALSKLPKAKHRYNMARMIPADDRRYKGIRSTVNASLALLAVPFKESKIQIKPADSKTIQIVYSSEQYNASAMVSLKPLKQQ